MRMKYRLLQSLAIVCLFFTLVAGQNAPISQQRKLPGFDRNSSDRERTLEKQFDSFLKKDDVRDGMKRLSARPHHVGSPYGKENADFIAGLFKSWGYDTEIERFDVLFPTPK